MKKSGENRHESLKEKAEKTAAIGAAVGGAAIGGAALFYLFENNAIATTELTYCSPRVPEGFDDCRIVQVSDLHNKTFGKGNKKLVRKIRNLQPDMIFLTGDLIDKRRPNLQGALEFAKQTVEIAPTYFVTGNHEQWSGIWEELIPGLYEAGITVLDNQYTALLRGDDALFLMGLADIDFISYNGEMDGGVMPKERKLRLNRGKPRYSPAQKDAFEAQLHKLCRQADLEWPSVMPYRDMAEKTPFKILLSHKPEFAEIYARQEVDLIFCGHAHGGQVRLPIIGGLYSPGQGLLPRFTNGMYDLKKRSGKKESEGMPEANSAMVVSRGMGDSVIPMRIGNRPELILVTLRRSR